VNRGDVRWYKFASPDKRRPVVILTRTSIIAYLGEVTVAPITSTIRDIPSEVTLTPHDGLSGTCAVNCDHLQTVSKNRLGTLITTLSADKMRRVGQAVAFAIDIGN
jgi:mRNA interferase MazF